MLFFAIFAALVLYWYYKFTEIELFYLPIFIGFVLVYIFPIIVTPILFVWLFIGKLMGEITSFLVLFIIYFFVFSPVTIINRLFKKKEQTGWIKRVNNEIDYKKLY